jgi:hypothetical protein
MSNLSDRAEIATSLLMWGIQMGETLGLDCPIGLDEHSIWSYSLYFSWTQYACEEERGLGCDGARILEIG